MATNLGGVLGITVKEVQIETSVDFARVFFAVGAKTSTSLQVGAAWLYVVGLLIALIVSWKTGFTEDPDQVVVTLPQLSQTLLGVAVGVLAVALS